MIKTIEAIRKIYFLENLHGIQSFLSLYEPGPESLIVMGSYPSLGKLLDWILPCENKISIGRINDDYLGKGKISKLKAFILQKIWSETEFEKINEGGHCYLFSEAFDEHLYIPLYYLVNRKGFELKFIPATRDTYPVDVKSNKRWTDFLYRKILGFYSGVSYSHVVSSLESAYGLGITNLANYEFRPPILDWPALAEKYRIPLPAIGIKTILLIDGPVQNYAGVNVNKSLKNFENWLEKMLADGFDIHVKPHYGTTKNSFESSQHLSRVKFLPKEFPVEFIMALYQNVYFFCTAASITRISGKKHCLTDLLEFDNQRDRIELIKHNEFLLKEQRDQIHFVSIDRLDSERA